MMKIMKRFNNFIDVIDMPLHVIKNENSIIIEADCI